MKTDNELIAEFMGLRSRIVGGYQPVEVWYKDDPEKWFSFPDYNTWNSLMPVVEKIEVMGYDTSMQWLNATIDDGDMNFICIGASSGETIAYEKSDVKIEAVYKAVIKFIKWYNSQGK